MHLNIKSDNDVISAENTAILYDFSETNTKNKNFNQTSIRQSKHLSISLYV